MVPIENLMLDGSNILVIPSYLYKDVDGDFVFTSVAEEIFANIIDKRHTSNLTEEEWLALCSVESSTNEQHVAEIRAPQRTQLCQPRRKGTKTHNFSIGEWVAFIQGSHWTVGEITDIDQENAHVKAMTQSIFGRNTFMQNNNSEPEFVDIDDLLCTVNPPSPTNSRGGHALSEGDFTKISSMIADRS